MYQIGNAIISSDILEKRFVCNLSLCKGICCIEGDSGAPLENYEIDILDEIYSNVRQFLSKESIIQIEKYGKYVLDLDGEWVTPLINNKECCYLIKDDNGVNLCAFEKAFKEGYTNFKKPISCHLYPIRITNYNKFCAVNYHEWEICNSACKLGDNLDIPIFIFLREALIRKFGIEWYNELLKLNQLLN